MLALGLLGACHHHPDQVVGNKPGIELLASHGGALDHKHLHMQRCFQIPEIHFDCPSPAVELNQALDRKLLPIHKGGEEPQINVATLTMHSCVNQSPLD